MPTRSELAELYKTRSAKELKDMFLRPDDWTDDALSAATAELERRGESEPESQRRPETNLPRRDLASKAYLTSLLRGAVLGCISVGIGWHLYDGSTRGEFSCSVSLVPCPVIGIGLIVLGVGLALIGIMGELHTR